MRYAGVKELKQRTMDLIKETKENDVIITAYGKPAAVLHHITEDDIADYLLENDPEFRSRIEEAYAEYLKLGAVTADDLLEKLERRRAKKEVCSGEFRAYYRIRDHDVVIVAVTPRKDSDKRLKRISEKRRKYRGGKK